VTKQPETFTPVQWQILPIPFRQKWWRETDYGARAPSADLIEEGKRLLAKEDGRSVARSYKAEVSTDGSGEFYSNGLRFATEQEAEDYVFNLLMRWTSVRDTRVVASDDPVSCRYVAGKVETLPEPAPEAYQNVEHQEGPRAD
jgi:hypothetical protein